jgi:hypothetical protein
MANPHGLDIRTPIGLMFTLLGVMVTGYGLFSDRSIYARSFGINVNLWWGLALLVFGLVFLWMARRGGSAMHSATEPVEPDER